jgi:sulfate transport system ATP-binding protein
MEFLGTVNRFEHGGERTFVRPHHLELDTVACGARSLPATVARVNSAGAVVRVDLVTDSGQPLHAAIPPDLHKRLALRQGGRVFVTPRESRVFAAS